MKRPEKLSENEALKAFKSLKPGMSLYEGYNRNARKIHIINIFDDNGGTAVVYKYFGRYKRYWNYSVKLDFEVVMAFEWGNWRFIK